MIIKCKMCGGDIQFNLGDTFGQCEYCGSTSTIPKADDEQKLNRYNRANHFRRQCEFDKAITAYERILEEDDTDAEAHWGIVLSRYGIEYVEDPVTKRRVPTCHRVQLESILADADYLAAIENAPDAESKKLYEEQAKEIAEIQKGILAISANEKPYDVFICYKETDDSGERTRDSALAQDVYYGLVEQGYKVFFSRITLEDKLGQQYEPYIFAALNSARVMIVIGTKPEYFNAVWVKNEWSRYLHLMKNDRKRLLIPCYRNMDPYDLPDELSNLQSQDMSKIGFMQDLLRGVRKVLDTEKAKSIPQQATVPDTGVQNTGSPIAPGVDSLLKRAYLFMEDGDFKNAAEYLDRVLDIDPECSSAYAAKVCVAFGLRKEADLGKATFLFEDNLDWQKAVRFADSEQKSIYQNYIFQVKDRIQTQIRNYAYDCAVEMAVKPGAERSKLDFELSSYRDACNYSSGNRPDGSRRPSSSEYEMAFMNAISRNEPGEKTEQQLESAADMFERINNPEARSCAAHCRDLAEQARQKFLYNWAITRREQSEGDPVGLEKAAEAFLSIPEYKDAKEQGRKCSQEAETIRASVYYDAVDAMKAAGNESQKWEEVKNKLADNRLNNYRDIDELREKARKNYDDCCSSEEEAKRQKEEQIRQAEKATATKKKRIKIICVVLIVVALSGLIVWNSIIIPNGHYKTGEELLAANKWDEAISEFSLSGSYKDSPTRIQEAQYNKAKEMMDSGKYDEALAVFSEIIEYQDSTAQYNECIYQQALEHMTANEFDDAYRKLTNIPGYKDVDSILTTNIEIKLAVGNRVTIGKKDGTPIEWRIIGRIEQKIGSYYVLLSNDVLFRTKAGNAITDDRLVEFQEGQVMESAKQFLNKAFDEISVVPEITVLTKEQVESFLPNKEDRLPNKGGDWWTNSGYHFGGYIVSSSGEIVDAKVNEIHGVRPAILYPMKALRQYVISN